MLSQQEGQSRVDHTDEEGGYLFVLQTTEPTANHLELACLHPFQKSPFEGFRVAMQAIATMVKTAGASA